MDLIKQRSHDVPNKTMTENTDSDLSEESTVPDENLNSDCTMPIMGTRRYSAGYLSQKPELSLHPKRHQPRLQILQERIPSHVQSWNSPQSSGEYGSGQVPIGIEHEATIQEKNENTSEVITTSYSQDDDDSRVGKTHYLFLKKRIDTPADEEEEDSFDENVPSQLLHFVEGLDEQITQAIHSIGEQEIEAERRSQKKKMSRVHEEIEEMGGVALLDDNASFFTPRNSFYTSHSSLDLTDDEITLEIGATDAISDYMKEEIEMFKADLRMEVEAYLGAIAEEAMKEASRVSQEMARMTIMTELQLTVEEASHRTELELAANQRQIKQAMHEMERKMSELRACNARLERDREAMRELRQELEEARGYRRFSIETGNRDLKDYVEVMDCSDRCLVLVEEDQREQAPTDNIPSIFDQLTLSSPTSKADVAQSSGLKCPMGGSGLGSSNNGSVSKWFDQNLSTLFCPGCFELPATD